MEKMFYEYKEQKDLLEQYEDILQIIVVEMTEETMKNPGTYVFAVTPEFSIFICNKSHQFLAEKYGVRLDDTLTEGYIRVTEDKNIVITCKEAIYQPRPGFRGSDEEFSVLKTAVKNKIKAHLV